MRAPDAQTLQKMDLYWRAANYLSAAQFFLLDNPLLKLPLAPDQINKLLTGHWGGDAGIEFHLCGAASPE